MFGSAHPQARDVHSAFMSPVLPLKASVQPVHHSSHTRATLLLAPGTPVDSKPSPSAVAAGHAGAVVGSWSHLSESMLELERALQSPLFAQSPSLSRGLSPSSRASTPPPLHTHTHTPLHNSSPLIFTRDKDSSLLKTILIPREPSPRHVSFDTVDADIQKQNVADSTLLVDDELPSLLFNQTLKCIRSSARSALSSFDVQAAPAVLAPIAPSIVSQSAPPLLRAEDIMISPVNAPHARQQRATHSETMCLGDLGFPASSSIASARLHGAQAPPPPRHKQLVDPFMCVSSQGLSHILATAYHRRLMLSCWRFWQVFVVASGNAKVLKLEMRVQELQTSFSSLQAKYSLVCSSEFSKRISTEHLRWSATELSAGGATAAVSKSSSGSHAVVSRFERIMFKAHMSLRVRTRLRYFHSWFMLAMRHRQLRSCYNIVSGRRVRGLLSSVVFSWYRGSHMQSKSRLVYSNREESDDSRQMQSQLARQEKMIESLRETNRKLELDLRRMVCARPSSYFFAHPYVFIQKEFTSTKHASVNATKQQYEELLRSNQIRQSQIDAVQSFLESKAARIHLVMQAGGKRGGIESVVADLLDVVREIRLSNRVSVK